MSENRHGEAFSCHFSSAGCIGEQFVADRALVVGGNSGSLTGGGNGCDRLSGVSGRNNGALEGDFILTLGIGEQQVTSAALVVGGVSRSCAGGGYCRNQFQFVDMRLLGVTCDKEAGCEQYNNYD